MAGDVVDLLPVVTGIGEATRVVSQTVKKVEKGGDVVEVAKSLRKAEKASSPIRKATGSYEILYKSKKTYIGKGGFDRAIKSAIQHTKNKRNEIIDSVVSIRWKSAPSVREAFIDEYFMQSRRYKGNIKNNHSYNKIWSPGKNIV